MSDAVSPSVRIILQHWAYNITLLHNLGVSYPGFGYSEEEKQQLGQLAKGVTVSGHLGFGMLNALYFLFLAGLVMGYGAMPLAFLLDPSHQSAGVFFGCLGLGLALGIGLGIPTAMGLTALTLRWLGKEPQPTEVDAKTIVALYRKLHHQLMRAAIVAGVLIGPFVLFGMTQVGGQLLEFVKRVVVTVTPFALVLLILSAMLRGEKKY
ncbi:MAG: hypothetical protein KA258_00600 [Deltaproteobacteria bacterium]|jgi:flagellar biosynthesis protein FliQ|nr:hypothetical protein [Deltaproteobacteria bacterium]